MVTTSAPSPEQVLETWKSTLKVSTADEIPNVNTEPLIIFSELFEFNNAAEELTSASVKVEYLPKDNYLDSRSFRSYLQHFKEARMAPETLLKIILGHLIQTLSPENLSCVLTIQFGSFTQTLSLGYEVPEQQMETTDG